MTHTCSCDRTFANRAGMLNHGKACPVERARSAAYVAALEASPRRDPQLAAAVAVQEAKRAAYYRTR
jgi:hypothetical protein